MRTMLILIWSAFATALPLNVLADNDEQPVVPVSPDLVHDISFDYELFQKEDGSYDCNGTIRFTIKYPDDTDWLVVCRTRRHLTDHDDHIFFGSHKIIYFSKEDSEYYFEENEKCSWGTYYRVHMLDKDKNLVYSPIICTNDYISPEDMERIMAPASIDSAGETDVQIRMEGKKLVVTTDRSTTVSAYTLDGRCLLSEDIAATTTIPLHDVASGILIVRYTTSNTTKTQKLLLQ